MRGKAPHPRGISSPFFFSFTSGIGRAQPNQGLNYSKLRAFSQSPVPRRAINLIKDQVSMLPWEIRLKNGKPANARQKKEIEIIKNVLNHPNQQDDWHSLAQMMLEDLTVVGSTAVEKRKWDNPEQPLMLFPTDGASIEIFMDWDGNPDSKRYSQRDVHGNKVDFSPNELLYARSNVRTNSPFGLSPLEVAAQDIDYFLAAKSYAGRTASLSSPDRALDLGEEVTPEQIKQYRIYWADEIEGRSKMPIIGGTKGAKSIPLAAVDDNGLFLKWQSFLIIQIANAFGIDPMKFGSLVGTTFANANVLDDSTDESAIRPYGQILESTVNREIIEFLGYDDYEFRFLWTSSFEDRKSQAAVDQVYLQMNVLQIDEARANIGLDPLPDGKGAMTLAEHLALYGGNNHVLGADVDKDAGDGNYGDNGNVPATLAKNAQDPTQNSNALNQTNRAGQTSKMQTRKDKPMNQPKNNLKI